MSVKACVYTVIVNNYDFLLPPSVQDPGIDYFLFSDDPNIQAKGWKVVRIGTHISGMTPAMINRHYKLFPFKHLQDYDLSIYIDGNVRVVGSLLPLIKCFNSSGAKIGLMKHPRRQSVEEEIEACVRLGKVKKPEEIKNEYQKYVGEGFSDAVGLTENNIIIRKHNDGSVVHAMEMWWSCLANGAGRDQISLPFVREKKQLEEEIYDFNARVENPYFKIYPHRSGKKLRDIGAYLYARGLTNIFYWWVSRLYSLSYLFSGKLYRIVAKFIK